MTRPELSALENRALVAADRRGMVTSLRRAASEFGIGSGAWRGELLDVVREAWGDDLARVQYASDGEWWLILPVTQRRFALGLHGVFGIDQIEQQAIVAALEAAPQVTT